MAQPGLIEDYLTELAGGLPAAIVAELADGLHETYRAHRRAGLTHDDAAHRAVTEFGDPGTLVAAFAATNPARRVARTLLLTGPLVGAAWASSLVLLHAWDWHVTNWARSGFGVVLLVGVAMLAVAAFTPGYRHAARSATAAVLAVLAVDVTMLTYLATAGLLTTWPVIMAAPLSIARSTFTLSKLPPILAVC